MTRLVLAATVSALALAACSQSEEVTEETVDTAPAAEAAAGDLAPGETVDATALEDALAIEDPAERMEALVERGEALQAAMEARFAYRISPLQEELGQVIAAIEATETELAQARFEASVPIVEEARACEGGDPAEPSFTVPEVSEDLSPAAQNEIVGAAYLAAADAATCVYQLESGLRFRIDAANPQGESPEGGESVMVHYEGTLPDGFEFDSSYGRGEPSVFPSDRLIRGWVEALSHMNTGETWSLFIPAELAYGPNGQGDIGPNSVLRFKVELLSLPMRAPAPTEAPADEPSDG